MGLGSGRRNRLDGRESKSRIQRSRHLHGDADRQRFERPGVARFDPGYGLPRAPRLELGDAFGWGRLPTGDLQRRRDWWACAVHIHMGLRRRGRRFGSGCLAQLCARDVSSHANGPRFIGWYVERLRWNDHRSQPSRDRDEPNPDAFGSPGADSFPRGPQPSGIAIDLSIANRRADHLARALDCGRQPPWFRGWEQPPPDHFAAAWLLVCDWPGRDAVQVLDPAPRLIPAQS
jgi:hypothetical protein